MKKKFSETWYKIMVGTSLLIASLAFFIHSITPAIANGGNNLKNNTSNYKLVPTNEDGSISVKLSDDQLNKIIPKNADGSINIKLSNEQLNKLTTNTGIIDVNISKLAGKWAGWMELPNGAAALCTAPPSGTDGWGWRHD